MADPQFQGQQLQQQSSYPFSYQHLGRALFQGESEKSLVDKLLGRQDADKLHALMQKEPLTKSDIEEILFLMTSIDQKIVNYNEWDRYVIIKLFPWIKHYSTICKTWMIYEEEFVAGNFDNDFTIVEKIEEKTDDKDNEETIEKIEKTIDKKLNKDSGKLEKTVKPILNETKTIIRETTKYLQHNFKFLISIFLLISNTTLSLDGAAFETLTTSRYEYSYPNIPLPQPQQRNSLVGNVFGKK